MSKNKLKQQIAQGEIGRVFQNLLQVTEGDYQSQIIHLSGRYSEYKKKYNLGLLSTDDANRIRNQITNSLLIVIDELPEEYEVIIKAGRKITSPSSEPRKVISPWKKWSAIAIAFIGLLASIAGILGYSFKDFFTNNSSEALNLTIKVRDENGNRPLKGQGEIVVDYGSGTQTLAIDSEGKIDLREIPAHLRNNSVDLILESSGYEEVQPKKTYPIDGKAITLLVQPKSARGWVRGKVTEKVTLKAIAFAQITLGIDTIFQADSLGFFRVYLPKRLQKEEYQLTASKAGYQSVNITHSPYSTDADIRLIPE